jgi:hypothetical protein
MRFSLSMGPLNEEVLLLLACHIDAHGMRFVLVQGKVRGRFQGKWLSFTLFSDPGKTPGKMALIQSATVVRHAELDAGKLLLQSPTSGRWR